VSRRLSIPLGIQIATAMVVSLLVAGVVIALQVRSVARTNMQQTFSDRVRRASMVTQSRLDSLATVALTGAVVLAQQDTFVSAWASGDVAGAVAVAARVGASVPSNLEGISGLALYDPAGRLLFDTARPTLPPGGEGPPEIAAVLQGGAPISGMRLDSTLGLAAYGAVIVRNAGQPIGVIELANGVGDAFATVTAGLTGTLVAFYSDAGPLASSDTSTRLDATRLTPAQEQSLAKQPDYVDFGGRSYLSSVSPIRDGSGTPIAYAYAGVPRSAVLGAVNAVRNRVIAVMAIAIAIGLALAAVSTLLTVRPLRSLVRSAQRIQANDLESAIEVSGPREARQLAEALNEMRLAIRQGREALLSTNQSLARQIDASSADLTEVTSELAVMHSVVAQLGGQTPGGLAGAADEMLRLPWADGTLIALAGEHQELVPVAMSALDPGTADAVLAAIRGELPGPGGADGFVVPQTGRAYPDLASRGVGGFIAMPMLTPEGIAGVVAITSRREVAVDPARRRLLESIAHEIASALEISELADEVEENRRIAEAVLREMSDGVVLLDSRGICRACNPSAAQLLGRPRAQLVGRAAEEFLPLGAGVIDELRARADGGPQTAPVLVDANGRRVAVTLGPFTDIDPARSGTIVLLRDLSAEAEAERVKQDFVSMVGHELRTPLTLIRTSIDLLREQDAGDLNPTQSRIVGVLQGNSDRLMSLISDLLDMSALDSGRVQISPETTDLAAVVAVAVDEARIGAAAKQIELAVDLPPEGATAWADRSRIHQVLANLLTNAIKYTPDGGHVTVRVADDRDDIRIAVRDDGIGIPPEEQVHLFEKFFRTTAGRRTTGGTGLGLAIARSIVDLHGGSIWCESDGRSGSTFVFTVPRRRP
jgi:signal transduction histidine kinase